MPFPSPSQKCACEKDADEDDVLVSSLECHLEGSSNVCKNAVKLEDRNWWNKEKLSLARDVELLSKPLDESTRVKQETKDILQKKLPCDMEMLSKALEGSSKDKYETKDKMRKTSSRNKMLPSKYRHYVLFV
ncbi:hypothetical protein NDU88_001883 [Pleurodeles waltl]|uniref:Uncharacterized protein n=1 Tax=Pleurodeles waltl TaxID=8319 RepID=A0AAV7UVK6_PLEWA|nr:hypothetical protein NDU88_001883 [Pleurodeles waltl]